MGCSSSVDELAVSVHVGNHRRSLKTKNKLEKSIEIGVSCKSVLCVCLGNYFLLLCLFFLNLFLRLCVDILCLFFFFPLGIVNEFVYEYLCYLFFTS